MAVSISNATYMATFHHINTLTCPLNGEELVPLDDITAVQKSDFDQIPSIERQNTGETNGGSSSYVLFNIV